MTEQTAAHLSPIADTQETSRPSSHWTAWGQWLALFTMTVDHLTRYVLPGDWDLNWAGSSIGRIAFPLFAAMVAWHGLFNTRNPLRYSWRILIIGLAAQIPYMMMPRTSDAFILNVCFTLASGLAIGALVRQGWQHYQQQTIGFGWLIFSAGVGVTVWYLLGFWVEYGHNGLLLIPLFMFAMQALNETHEALKPRLWAGLAAFPVLWIAGQMNASDMAKSFTVATCVIVLVLAAGAAQRIPPVAFVMPRRLWLAWYPGHFALIALWLLLSGQLAG
ncbi:MULTISPECIES: TraX family protein [unclassified Halomonas]|uniref:TraX family protein n=1 Tax=unclassified Halomonas TaxID=2609666 RepID=UPI0009909CA9|nr:MULTISPECIES: TraX family protein [unclassified Halomonas]AQU83108.1 TraX [Halomonas sp. 'Soap Lake \